MPRDFVLPVQVSRIEATLLEYGEKIYGPARVDEEQEENRRARGKLVKVCIGL